MKTLVSIGWERINAMYYWAIYWAADGSEGVAGVLWVSYFSKSGWVMSLMSMKCWRTLHSALYILLLFWYDLAYWANRQIMPSWCMLSTVWYI